MNQTKVLPYTPVIIKLLKGPVEYLEKNTWEKLMQFKNELQAFLIPLGLLLVIEEEDGYAYLKHNSSEEDDVEVSWAQRRALTYEESVMLILLREMLAEFETGEAITRELIRKRREIKEYAELFFKENNSRVKFLKEIDRLIEKVAELGFLDKVENNDIPDEERFRICKILKARVNAETLDDFYLQLQRAKEQGSVAGVEKEIFN